MKRPGATAAPGKTSCTAWRRLAKAGWSTLETGDGSVACITSTLTRGSLMTRTSRALTAATESRGWRRWLTMAAAVCGSTLDLAPARKTVSAVVVRTSVAVRGLAANTSFSRGAKSHRLDMSGCSGQPKPPRSAPSSRHMESEWVGKGLRSSRDAARATMPMALSAGGVEAWAVGSRSAFGSMERRIVAMPFSATQIIATGCAKPGSNPSSTKSPSSRRNSSVTPRSASRRAMCLAPSSPPSSSS
mmetsp:Transcript_29274/g.69520  ORF Transcript_29274/g.69520 Transcript_29274/m.69520 type:complete len:245 (-) Transcript_29274:14-748(-)